ncbi:MAG: hypothetical protein R3F56_21100 [Planctomycetota bacterium]
MRLLVSVLATATLAHTSRGQARVDQDAARQWASVTEWVGFWEASETRTYDYRNSLNASLWAQTWREAQTSSRFRLRRASAGVSADPTEGTFEWVGTGVEQWLSSESSAESGASAHATQTAGAGRVPSSAVTFRVKLKEGLATFGPGANDEWPTGRTSGWIGSEQNRRSVDRTTPLLRAVPTLYKGEQRAGWWDFRAPPGVITFTDDRTTQKTEGDGTHGYVYRGRVVLCPVYDDLECEVTIDGYADWLPRGSIQDPKKPGSALVARAVLRSKKGRSEDIPEVDRFRFELLDTSREPGVCLNWPLAAKDEDFDLRLAEFTDGSGGPDPAAVKRFLREWDAMSAGDRDLDSLPPDVPQFAFPVISDNGQKGEVVGPPKDRSGRPFADAAIECFDFGAKSELRVVCVLKDGREIIGLMKGEGGDQDIVRLPRRRGPDWVAAKWCEDHRATDLAASADDEKVAGQPMNGDGFTLYEEYRGWVEAGRHIDGDPERKDFFVQNKIGVGASNGGDGADGRAGIALFARIAKLRVHARITDAEFDWRVRVMNGNRRDGPHRVKQHGVFIAEIPWRQGDVTGGKTTLRDPSRAGRPATTLSMGILRRGDPKSVFTDEWNKFANLPKSDADSAYDVAVAHELAHSVGAQHHGEGGDRPMDLFFQGAGDPMNSTGLPRFVQRLPPSDADLAATIFASRPKVWSDFDRGPTIHLYWEDTHEDVAELLGPAFERALDRERTDPLNPGGGRAYAERRAAQFSRWGKDARFFEELALHTSVAGGTTKAEWTGHGFSGGGKFDRRIYSANPNCLQSGDVGCVMRYFFANAYPAQGRANTYYLIRPGKNPIGHELCRGPAGTGGNHRDHEPQPRFGDCASGRGNCFGQICPNDAIPAPES